jgi:hypothetical protein
MGGSIGKLKTVRRLCYGLATSLLLSACATPIVVTPPGAGIQTPRQAETMGEIKRLGRNGDWLVIRGYHATDDLVSALTNTPWSHAALLDRDNDQVIEAESQGVHTSSLSDFVAKSHRLLLIRPNWSTATSSLEALAGARKLVGKGYDLPGLIGLNVPEHYYCSELAVAVYKPHIPDSVHIPRPVTPAQLHYWGRILYDSGNP